MTQNNVSHENVLASNVTGTSVYNAQGDNLGEVHDIVIGKRDGKVKYAILSIGGFLGIGEEHNPIPWAELDYSEQRGGFVINRSREQLSSAPRYAKGSEPDWSDRSYGEKVYGYYGVPYI